MSLAKLDAKAVPPALSTTHELLIAGIAARRVQATEGATRARPRGARRAPIGNPRIDGGG
jgi:hypothetical protein